jgi:hypothetical protein
MLHSIDEIGARAPSVLLFFGDDGLVFSVNDTRGRAFFLCDIFYVMLID